MSKEKVLFLCTGNSCRSQIAEGLLRHFGGDKFEVFSAGVDPKGVNPLSIKVMGEVDIDISNHKSKSVDEFLSGEFDYVITVCDNAKKVCPVFPGKFEKLHWDLVDPAEAKGTEEEKLKVFRKIRDQMKEYVNDFVKDK